MPKRTDIRKILLIGSGPIVIGQACEFDYSGTQACKALREEGFEVVLVNSNPATIMTDPEIADRTYIEPLTPGGRGARSSSASGPTRSCRRSAGRPALNLALALAERRRARALRRRADRRQARRPSRRPRTASCSRQAMRAIGLELPALAATRASLERGARGRPRRSGCPAIIRPVVHARRHRRRHRLQPRRVRGARSRWGLAACARSAQVLVEESVIGWKEFELEVMRDLARQRRHHLLDRELRPDGRPHRRLDHRRAGADADRQGIPADARRRARDHPRDRRRDRRLEHPVRRQSRRRAAWSSSR